MGGWPGVAGGRECVFRVFRSSLIFPFFNFDFYFFLAALSLRCCTWGLSSFGEQGRLFTAARGFLVAGSTGSKVHWFQ